MSANEIIQQAIDLKPQERYLIIESLVQSLNEPDKNIEKLWIEESQKRLNSYSDGTLQTVSFEEVFEK
ncbi:MAG: addiction module protein [Epsilonproteobacteria bacterium]|nr:MAG: addiction module protein [Campylobacterota bacterium]